MDDFDWNIWLKKLGKKILFAVILGVLAETSAHLGTEPVPTEYVWVTVFGVQTIEIIINAIKHKFLAKE